MIKKIKDNNFLTPLKLEEQENLSLSRLKLISISSAFEPCNPRPKDSFIELMNWVKDNYSNSLKEKRNINKFIHNRILIDGQFLQFCEEKNIFLKCLYKDSIVSWKTDNNYEKFFIQGIFHISWENYEFIHSALFHKGNQNEDEISFFNLVDESNFEAYLKLRNEFDSWVLDRDRSNLHIRVIDGEDIPYTRDHSWEDLFLPQEIKNDIRSLVENFLNSKDFYIENKIPWKRGVLMFGEAGCGKTSIIRTIISNYNFKPITMIPNANDDAIREAFAYAEEQSPSLLYFEDLDSLLDKTIDSSSFLNLMDGISAKNGLLVMATANDISRLRSNITDRPSRFDRKFEIPLPDINMTSTYLKKWFGNTISLKQINNLSKYTVQYKFSYAYLKELYISSMFEALSHNRKTPTEKDISKALDRLMNDKNLIKSGRLINTEKYFSK